jgi:hypothetical protein
MPYQPTVTDRTGEFLFRGITGAADSLSDAMKQRKQQSQKASTLRKTIGVYNPELKDEVQTMGLADLEGYVAGLGMKAAQDKLAQDQANKDREFNLAKLYADLQQGTLARTNERDAAGRRFTQGLAARATAGGAPSMDFANTLAGEPQPARELGFTDIVQEAGASGLAMQPVELAPLLRAEQMGQRQDRPAWAGPDIKVLTNPVTGAKVPVFVGGPNQASLMPDDELSPQGKQRAIDQLQARQAQLAIKLADSFGTQEEKAKMAQVLDEVEQRLAALTGEPRQPATAPTGESAGNEVTRVTKDGRKAVFDATTKKFLRYAN